MLACAGAFSGLLVIFGAFAPWVYVATATFTGLDGIGVPTIFCGAIGVAGSALDGLSSRYATRLAIAAAGAIALLIVAGAWVLGHLAGHASGLVLALLARGHSSSIVDALTGISFGWGLTVVALGGAGLVAVGLVPRPRPAGEPSGFGGTSATLDDRAPAPDSLW